LSRFVILIPSFNEYPSLKKILNKIHKKYPILVMNDCSSDRTKNLNTKFKKIFLCNNKKRLGYENNIKKGFKLLLKRKFEYIVTFDADGEHHINNLKNIEEIISKNPQYDMLIGERSYLNRFSEKIVSYLFYQKYNIKDPLSGLKIYKINSLKKLYKNINEGFFLVDLVNIFLKKKRKIKNFKIISVKIQQRKSKVGSFALANFKVLKCLKFLF